MEASLAKLLLLIAAILGILVGILTLVGGICAAEDKDRDDVLTEPAVTNGKYWCGMKRVKSKSAGSCDWDAADRGWFRRVYDQKKDKKIFSGLAPNEDDLKKLVGYEAVLSYAIICGVGWIAGGAIAFLAHMKMNKQFALIGGAIFGVIYLLFVALFGAIWDSIDKVQDDCSPHLSSACSDLKKQIRRSENEFLGYSIVAFVCILYCIIACILFFLKADTSSAGGSEQAAKSPPAPAPAPAPTNAYAHVREEQKNNSQAAPAPSATPANQNIPPAGAPKKPKDPEVEKLSMMFKKVNKYLVDDSRLTSSADKKFKKIDTDNSGQINASELKNFIAEVMAKKGLKCPNDAKIEALKKKYDTDGSGHLEFSEFKKMLYDIFNSARTSLIKKYALKKASLMKASKPGSSDISGATSLETILRTFDTLEPELMKVAKEVDTDGNANLDINEVTALIAKFSTKYNIPSFSKDEVIEIMDDMDRQIGTYTPKDLRMACFAILLIGKNIVKPK